MVGFLVLASLIGFGLLSAVLMAFAQWRLYRKPRAAPLAEKPSVSILKPLKGLDPDLETNLRSIYEIDYPSGHFEVILGAEDENDPAVVLATEVAVQYPHISSHVMSGAPPVAHNPKINNLANLYSRASHPLILISDSNIRVPTDYLTDLTERLEANGGGVVWSLFRGTDAKGVGGALESLQLNTQALAGAAAYTGILGRICALGKSMLIDRKSLEEIGGFKFLGQFLAEDQILAEEFTKRQIPVEATGIVVDNVLGRRSLGDFLSRQLRWMRLRRYLNFPGYALEFSINPTFLALVGMAVLHDARGLWLFTGTLAFMSVMNLIIERLAGVRRNPLLYPVLELGLSICRGILWPLGFVSGRVAWRGNAFRLGKKSRLTPMGKVLSSKQAKQVHSVSA